MSRSSAATHVASQANMQRPAGGRGDSLSTAVSGPPLEDHTSPVTLPNQIPSTIPQSPNCHLHKVSYKEKHLAITSERLESVKDMLAAVNFLFLEQHGDLSNFESIQQEQRTDSVCAGWTELHTGTNTGLLVSSGSSCDERCGTFTARTGGSGCIFASGDVMCCRM